MTLAHIKYNENIFGGSIMKRSEMPIGFSMALTENPEAMKKFASLSEEKKRTVVEGSHYVRSRSEMHRYVNEILKDM